MLAGFSAAAWGDPRQATLSAALLSVRTGLVLQDGRLGGDAAPVLAAALDDARYVLIGEDHLTREIPLFTAAVCDEMAARGLAAMAIETAPQVAALISPLLAAGQAAPALKALLHQYPASVAFLDMRDEIDLVTHCTATNRTENVRVWGLDQAFLGAAGWLLDRVAARHVPGDAARQVAALQAEEQRDAQAAARTGDASRLFLLAAGDASLAGTAKALRNAGDPVATALFDEIAASHAIYADPSGHDSNRRRALLLKQNFAHDLQALAAPAPRVLLKFGESHLYRGFNELHQADLGNFVSELADGQGARSLHIAVLGQSGVHRRFGGYDRPTQLAPFTLTDDPDYAWLRPAMAVLRPAGWTMFDLRALRFRNLAGVTAAWTRMIDGYDLLVIIPKITPATPLEVR